jgi:hypothetical protein
MNRIFKQTLKKLIKTGFFRVQSITENAISFKHFERVFSLQVMPDNKPGLLYSSGYVHTGKALLPTFESEYQNYELTEVSQFIADYRQRTDNPDFVLRQSLYLIGITN